MRYVVCLAIAPLVIIAATPCVTAQNQRETLQASLKADDQEMSRKQLRAKLRRTKEELKQARASDEADPQEVKQLARKVRDLRQRIKAQPTSAPVGADAQKQEAPAPAGCRRQGAGPCCQGRRCNGPQGPPWARGAQVRTDDERPSGGGFGRGRRGGAADASTLATDHDVIHFLADHRQEIDRTVTELPDGVSTVTESDNPEIAAAIQRHVKAMTRRVEQGQPIRMRDPLFAAIFRHADTIDMTYERTSKGVNVTETSEDPKVVELIQAHAKVVSRFVENGYRELRKNHPVPITSDDVSAAPNAGRAGPPGGFGRGPGRGMGRGQGRGPAAGYGRSRGRAAGR